MPTASPETSRAIVRVIEEESAAFWSKDFEGVARHWVHAPHARHMGWWNRGGISVMTGWREIAARMKGRMEANPEPNPTARAVQRDNVSVQTSGDLAWMTFAQYGIETGDRQMDMPGLSHETRILEKHGADWKIVYAGWLLAGPDDGETGTTAGRRTGIV